MTEFRYFRWKDSGVVELYPADWDKHPVFGDLIEPYELGDSEFEEDKVSFDNHNLPVDQRGEIIATRLEDLTVDELRSLLSEKGLSTSGNKPDLISRLNGVAVDESSDSTETTTEESE